MKFLHTADWNLSVKTDGRSRLDEQKNVLDEILSIANFESVDCVVVSGNIFASKTPTAEAEQVFYEAISKLAAGGNRFVLVLAGNHDNPKKIEAMLPLSSKENIALIGDLKKLDAESFNPGASVKVVETGVGYVKIQKEDEVCTIAYLPFPTEQTISERVEGNSYCEKVKKWADIGAAAFSEDSFNMFCAHLLVKDPKDSEERVKDEMLSVDLEYLPKAHYTALGHIIYPEALAENVYYSGSIIALTPNSDGQSVNIVESENNKLVSVKSLKLKNTLKFEKVEVKYVQDAEKALQNYDENDIVELEITSDEVIPSLTLKRLRKNFPCISSIILSGRKIESRPISKENFLQDDKTLFEEFYARKFNKEPSENLIEAFLECIGDEDETN